MPKYEDLPVLPEESNDLAVHVKQCTMRYNALLKRIQFSDLMSWIYRAVMLPAVGFLCLKMWELMKFPSFFTSP